MRNGLGHIGGAAAIALLLSLGGSAHAQPAPPPPPPPPPAKAASTGAAPPADAAPAPPDESKKGDARTHFDKGLTLLQEGAWAAALAEFRTSRELYPTRAATQNLGTALRKLQRYDEALDVYETLLRDFPTMPPEARQEAQQALAELRDLVGTIDIRSAEPGAAIIISGVSRGEYPPISPLRVSAGTHVVRVLKEGFEPFEQKIDVTGGQTATLTAKLRPVLASGRLRVEEGKNRPLDVFVDGAPKGPAPWVGVLPVGNHAVSLRGKGRLGTPPSQVTIKLNQLTPLKLTADELDANVRVVPTPASGVVSIDGVPVGGGGEWFGELKSGTHRIGVAMDGYLPETREVKLARGDVQRVVIKLEIDPRSPMWRKPSRWFIDVDAAAAVVLPSLGGPAGSSSGSRSQGVGALGAFHAGYELGNGFGFGLSAGYLFLSQSVSGRQESLTPLGFDKAETGKASDDLRLSAFMGGAHLSYHTGDKVPFLLRLGAGGLVGQARDERRGTFTTVNGGVSYPVDTAVTRALAGYFYADLALHVGVKLGDNVDLGVGVQGLVMIALSQPKWDSSIDLYTGKRPTTQSPNPATDGVARYHDDPMMGSFVFALVPGLGLRYTF